MYSLLLAVIYLSFISLGLPDSLLGAAWPSIYGEIGVPLSYAGILSAIIAAGTVLSSLNSERLNRRLGTGVVTLLSVAATAAALFGFSHSGAFWQLCLWALPYGLGAGSVDATLNNYVALHYSSRHMSWLHCMWGLGASSGPLLMGMALSRQLGWQSGYRMVGTLQLILTAILLLSLHLWKKPAAEERRDRAAALSIGQVGNIPGAKEIMLSFFCYSGVEQTAILWAGSYLNLAHGLSSDAAASFAGLFCMGITLGRALSGFMTMRLSDKQMIRLGQAIILLGVILLLLPLGQYAAFAGLLTVGLGCAPIYPCIIHSTPEHFGAQRSQALIGVQMASAYVGTCLLPPLFGFLARSLSVKLLPWWLLLLLLVMTLSHEQVLKQYKA